MGVGVGVGVSVTMAIAMHGCNALKYHLPFGNTYITLFISMTMLCRIDNILQNILHIQSNVRDFP